MRLIFLFFLLPFICDGQIIRAEPFYTAPEEGVTNLLLDDYPGAAVAYSLRKLDKDYTGSAIRVRRSSDNTEQDIGFVNNYLDTAAMKTFVGANNGFVVTWYNQADSSGVFGVRNATQSTAANQPQIILSGAVIYTGNKSSMSFNADWFTTRFNIAASTASVTFATIYADTAFGNPQVSRIVDHSGTLGNRNMSIVSNQLNIFDGANSSQGGTLSYKTKYILNGEYFLNNGKSYINNSLVSTQTTFNLRDVNSVVIGSGATTNMTNFAGNLQELIIYPSDQSSNRSNINTNINSFYSIY